MYNGKEGGVLWNGQKAGGLSLRVKRDERVGVWWLDGVGVSVLAWCQTLCHCPCQSHSVLPPKSSVSRFEFHCKLKSSLVLIVC